jgi:lipopolysaccharide biosynthesis glycosyltransferase
VTDRAEAPLQLVMAVDASYVAPLLVALASLQRCVPASRQVKLHLIHTGLRDEDLERVAGFTELDAVVPGQALLRELRLHRHFPPEAAAPLLLAELLPSGTDRVVFLDADVLVLDDPTDLWTAGLDGHPLGAVVDVAIPRCSSPRGVPDWRGLGIPPEAAYFNAGVLAVSLDAWRSADVGARTLARLADTARRGSFHHQGALNAVLWRDWKPLASRLNVSSLAGRSFGVPCPERPAIVHFAGHFKPWRSRLGGPFQAAYGAVLDEVSGGAADLDSTVRDRILSTYDRLLRRRLYSLERALWERALI